MNPFGGCIVKHLLIMGEDADDNTCIHRRRPIRHMRQSPACLDRGLGLTTKWVCSATEVLGGS